MTDIDTQLKQLEAASALAATNIDFLPLVLSSMLSILEGNEEPRVVGWCLSYIWTLTNFNSRLDIPLRKSLSIQILDSFVRIVDPESALDSSSKKDESNGEGEDDDDDDYKLESDDDTTLNDTFKSPILSDITLLKKFITISIDLYDLTFLNISDNLDNSQQLWSQMDKLKKFVLLQWDGSYPLTVPLEDSSQNNDNDENVTRNIVVKLVLLKFLFRIIEIQAVPPPKDPRKRRQQKNNLKPVNTQNLSMTMLDDLQESSGIIKEELHKESDLLLQFAVNLLVYKQTLSCQLFSSICFLLIKLIQKRPYLSKPIVKSLAKLDLDQKMPIERELFLLNIDDERDNYYRMKYKLEKRFSHRSMKIMIDFLFRNNFLNPFVKKNDLLQKDPTNISILSEHDQISLNFLNKINYILQIQNHERTNKNLLVDLRHDNFIPIVKRARFYQKKQLFDRNGKMTYLSLYKTALAPTKILGSVSEIAPLEFDISTIKNLDIIVNMVLIAVKKASSQEIIEKLTRIGETYRQVFVTNEIEIKAKRREYSDNNGHNAESESDSQKKRIKLMENGKADTVSIENGQPLPEQQTNGFAGKVEIKQEAKQEQNEEDQEEDEYDPEAIDIPSQSPSDTESVEDSYDPTKLENYSSEATSTMLEY